MPLLVLLLVALLIGGLAAFAARRHLRPSTPGGEPTPATGLALTLALVLVLGGGAVLAALVALVRHSHGLAVIDSAAANWGDRHAGGLSTEGLQLVTALGETWTVVVVGTVIALVEIGRSRSRWAGPFLLAVVVGDKLLTEAIKQLVDRVRPDLNPLAATLGPSFPSGHSSTAAAFWAAAALVIGSRCGPRGRAALIGLAAGIAVAVAASRVLLDVHWLSDALGGVALGWAWFAACAVAFGGRLLTTVR